MGERLMATYTDSRGRERFMVVDVPPMGTDIGAWEAEVDRLEANARRFATLNEALLASERVREPKEET